MPAAPDAVTHALRTRAPARLPPPPLPLRLVAAFPDRAPSVTGAVAQGTPPGQEPKAHPVRARAMLADGTRRAPPRRTRRIHAPSLPEIGAKDRAGRGLPASTAPLPVPGIVSAWRIHLRKRTVNRLLGSGCVRLPAILPTADRDEMARPGQAVLSAGAGCTRWLAGTSTRLDNLRSSGPGPPHAATAKIRRSGATPGRGPSHTR